MFQAYAETVPYPLASSLAQEIFQSGIIPGDTDYRIFRDFGHISGKIPFKIIFFNLYFLYILLLRLDWLPRGC